LAGCKPESAPDHISVARASPENNNTAGLRRFIDFPLSGFQLPENAERPPTNAAGGTLRISTSSDFANLNPHAVSAFNMTWFCRLVYDNLVYRDANFRASPWLAKSWDISPDGLTYTFHLRDDVTFSDGAKFNAEAVLINLEHMRDPATKSPLAGRYIVPYSHGEILDEYTFRAHLREPYEPFLDVLAQSWLPMISPKAIRENPNGLATRPVGSGPFVLENFTRQVGLTFVRRPDYHWSPDFLRHTGPAYLDRIEVEIVPEALIRTSALLGGQHTLTLELPPQSVAELRANPDYIVSNRVRNGNTMRAITFNMEKAPFDDVRVRRALALATDREGIAAINGFGEFLVTADFVNSSTKHYDPAYRDVLHYDPAAANRLLDEAGWTGSDAQGYRTHASDGRRLGAEMLTGDAWSPAATAVALQSDLKKIGFELRILQLPAGQLTDRRNQGEYQAFSGGGGWHTNTPDALYILHHSAEIINLPKVYGANTGRVHDPELDDLLARARRTLDQETQRALYSAAQRRMVELVPGVPIYETQHIFAYHRRLRGVLFDTSHTTPILTAAWLEKTIP
jgi:peptide/nickel transport system substrate-binding protein